MKKTKLIAIAGGAVVLLGVAAFLIFGGSATNSSTPVGQLTRTVTVTRGDLDLTVSANGVVQPISKVELRSKAGGEIMQLNFVEGQAVRKGDLLIAVDQRLTLNDFEQAKADLATAEAAVRQQENNNNRSRELHQKGLISQQELDQANVDYVRAKSTLVKAKASLASAEERLRETRITAPISGTILSKTVEIGQIISSAVSNVGGGTLLATLADMKEVHVEANVDEVDIGNVMVGQRAKVIADAFPDDSYYGEVIRIAPLGKTSQNVTTFSVLILVRNENGKLKAGMSTTVDIEIFRRRNVLLIPNEALVDPQSEQGRELLASLAESDSAKSASGDSASRGRSGQMDFREMRDRMANATPEERQKMREEFQKRLQNMSPEERERFQAMRRERMAQQGGGSGGGPTGGGGGMMFFSFEGPGSGPRTRRAPQASAAAAPKERVVEVRNGERVVPRLIRIGAANFDNAEVLSGLSEGDSIQYATISRAKIAAEQMNQRMRSAQSLGGTGSTGRMR
jgi:HlyD family secretion protein